MPWVRWRSSRAEPPPSSCKGWGAGQALAVPWWDTGKESKVIWYHWEERGKGITYIPDSWWERQWGAKRVLLEVEAFLESEERAPARSRAQRDAGAWREAGWPAAASWPWVCGSVPGREIPGLLPASLGGKQLPMVLVRVGLLGAVQRAGAL